jgi:hypothetical protein
MADRRQVGRQRALAFDLRPFSVESACFSYQVDLFNVALAAQRQFNNVQRIDGGLDLMCCYVVVTLCALAHGMRFMSFLFFAPFSS